MRGEKETCVHTRISNLAVSFNDKGQGTHPPVAQDQWSSPDIWTSGGVVTNGARNSGEERTSVGDGYAFVAEVHSERGKNMINSSSRLGN